MKRVRRQVDVPEDGWVDGRGITVAVLDSGVARHPDLSGRILAFKDFVYEKKEPYDDNGHGTHVCGILCGSGMLSEREMRGMAPRATLVVGKVLDRNGDGSAEDMMRGLEWIQRVRKQYRIRVLNISVGMGRFRTGERVIDLERKLEEITRDGIIVICAAGNKGPGDNSISSLGKNRKFITVGCHDGMFLKDSPKRCELYSGRGMARAADRKPDLVAPGTGIYACSSGFGGKNGKLQSAYISKSGTSMATPIVSGAAALALQAFPEISPEALKQKITLTATDLGEPWNKQGWGMLNVRHLLE